MGVEEEFYSGRRADMKIFKNGNEIGLVEIKYQDKALDGQIEDYLKYCESKGMPFAYLTLCTPERKERELIESASADAHHVLYRELCLGIEKRKLDANPVVKLFCKFIRESHMVYDEPYLNKNMDVLEYIMLRSLHVKHNHGFGRKVSEKNISGVSDYWGQLIGNVKVLADRFYSDFGYLFNTQPQVDFYIEPEFDLKRVLKQLQESDSDSDYLTRESRVGGLLSVFFAARVKQVNTDNWLSLIGGYEFYLDLKEKALKVAIFGKVSGRRMDEEAGYVSKGVKEVPDLEVCYDKMLGCILDSVKSSLQNPENVEAFKIVPDFKKRLNEFERYAGKSLSAS